ncbi:MAG: M56 family metallopeptidase [Firmicutes bacterium]|nr:M56 family metallopeptidase [Bacillota bacterium]
MDINITSFLWVNAAGCLFLIFLVLLTRSLKTIPRIPVQAIMFSVVLVGLRLFIPAEFPKMTKIYNIYTTLPAIYAIANTPLKDGTGITPSLIFKAIWAAVSILLLARYFYNIIKIDRIVKCIPEEKNHARDILETTMREMGCDFNVRLIQTNTVEFPAEYGFFGQTVFLNGYNYTDEELRYIFMHELAHFKYYTNHMRAVMDIMLAVFWWNPVVHLFAHYFNENIEIYTDRCAAGKLSKSEKSAYMRCILKVSEIIYPSDTDPFIIEPLINSTDKFMFKRFKILASNKKHSIVITAGLVTASVVFVIATSLYQVQLGWQPPAREMQNITPDMITPETSFIVYKKQEDIYILHYTEEDLDIPVFITKEQAEERSDLPIIIEESP